MLNTKALMLVAALSTSAITLAKTVVIYPQQGRNSAQLSVGDKLEVRLTGTTGNGHRWVRSATNSRYLRFDDEDSNQNGNGIGNQDDWDENRRDSNQNRRQQWDQRFIYTALRTGTTKVSFTLKGRGNNPNTKTVSANVQIGRGSNNGGNDNSDKVILFDKDNGTSVRLRVGQMLMVRLQTQPSSGARWVYSSRQLSAVKYDSQELRDPKTDGRGATTVMVFRFTGRAEGNDNLRFAYVGRNGNSIKNWSTSVTVRR